jgi:hypothetical protein
MACIWYGVQSWIGGNCVYLMIRAIWNNWRDVSIELAVRGADKLTSPGRCHGWYQERYSKLRDNDRPLRIILLVLVVLSSLHISSGPQDSPSFYSQGILCAHSRDRVLHLGHCTSKGYRAHRPHARYQKWLCPRLAHGPRHHECHRQLCNSDCQRS